MLIYLTTDKNNGVFDFLLEENGIPTRKFIGEFSLVDFVKNNLSKFDSCRYLVVDLESLLDIPEGLFSAIDAVKEWFLPRLIIFSRNIDPDLKQELLEHEVYNIISGDPLEYKDLILKALSPEGMTFQDYIVSSSNESLKSNQTPIADKIKESIEIEDDPQHTINHNDTFIERAVMVAGSQHRTGTTTTAIQMANFLANQGKSVAYMEVNQHNHLKNIIEAYHMKLIKTEEGDYWQMKGVDYFLNDGIFMKDYDYFVFDLGVIGEVEIEPFSKGDIKILCGSGKSFERDHLLYATSFCKKENIEGVNTIISFLSKEEQVTVKELFKTAKFAEFSPNLMGWHENEELFKDIFKFN
jgi:hypothetical protein